MRKFISKELRIKVRDKFGGLCAYCGVAPKQMHIDHVIPVSRGGDNSIANLMPACSQCNNFKMNFSVEQFRSELSMQVNRARNYSVNFRNAERFGLIQEISSEIVFHFERNPGEVKP